ncbi:Enoyl-CoA hydratase [Paragonimus skrjabini miyazakii]|uniref:Enoyl-CoA hydratase n=1 Tax=Paragonimus skrjabini miyazakii TaxID=59628 RepID=A0A8S9YIP2_9TREM|nr:Enoyl-CoA hydratase [Paragonimus skrjabini miyazakii]
MMDMGTARLPALIGLSRALDLVLTGRSLTASEAHQFGLVNRVAKVGTAVGIAVKLVDTICQLPGQSAILADREGLLRASEFAFRLATEEFERAQEAFLADRHAGLRIFFEERLKTDRRRI